MTVVVAVAFVGLMLTGWYAIQDPSGPSATPILMFMVLVIAMGLLLVITPVNLVRWASAAGRGFAFKALVVAVSFVLVGLIWTFAVWATDPNYPERLFRGRVLFFVYSAGLCAFNYGLIRRFGSAGV